MGLSQKTFQKSLFLVGILCASTLTHADQPQTFDYNKASTNYIDNTTSGGDLFSKAYYVGGTIGQSEASSFCNGDSGCEDSDSAWKVFGGYQIRDNISIEGAYLNLGDIRKNGQSSDISAFAAYGVGTLPITERFDAFAKIGGSYWKSENTDGDRNGFGLAYGLGAKMSLNETTKLRAEWESIPNVQTSSNEDNDINMLSIGVEFRTF